MKIIVFTLLLLGMIIEDSGAQISMQPAVPATGLIQKSQLWNIVVINNSEVAYSDCRIQVLITDRMTRRELFTATTTGFLLSKGSRQLNVSSLNPIQYNYLSGTSNNSINSLIKAGSYMACYTLSGTHISKDQILAEECIQFDTEPLSPPILILPADSALMPAAPNQFSWIPPTPANMFEKLQYEVVITKVPEGQKANEAIQNNIPFFSDANLNTTMLNYPASLSNFEKDKWYAWQVIARDGENYAGKSETWVFKVSDEAPPAQLVSDIYLLMQEAVMGAYEINGKLLHIKYFSHSAESEGRIYFTDIQGKPLKTIKKNFLQGDNYFDFELGKQFKPGKTYKIFLEGENKKRLSLIFSIKNK